MALDKSPDENTHRSQAESDPAQSDPDGPAPERLAGFWTIPNMLCLIRLVGSPGLIGLSVTDDRILFLSVFLFLAMTDWVDGKLAILLNQRSVFGARLDSWADACFYGSTVIGGSWLLRNELLPEWPWIIAPIVSYTVSTLAGFRKFGKWPSYHTRMAKISWGLVTLGMASIILNWSIWPLRIACAAVVLTNLEAILITWTLSRWHADVLYWWQAREIEKRESRAIDSDSNEFRPET